VFVEVKKQYRRCSVDNAYVCLVQAQGITGLMLTKAHGQQRYSIHGFETLAEGLHYFEDSYNRAHRRSYEASMSACINAISFRPSILRLSIEEIQQYLEGEPRGVHVRNVSGGMMLLPLKDAEQLWESGVKPGLIDNQQMQKLEAEKAKKAEVY